MKVFNDFKSLPKGIKRVIIAGGIFLPFILGGLTSDFYLDGNWLPTVFIIFMPAYWVLILTIIWIYMGFKEDQKVK